jgi:ubiquinone/menaquinone biosynthesis C-methylase UbiE
VTDYYERHGNYAAAAWHRRFLNYSYRRSYRALQDLGCSPLDVPEARVLLCGVGASSTTLEFATFLRSRQSSTRLVVLDLESPPLIASKAAVESQPVLEDVTFVRADARALPFADASFDLVETDFLLQFLNSADRRKVLREWARVLRPGAAIMTRDWVTHNRGLDLLWDALHRAVLRIVLSARTYVLTGEEIRSGLQDAGFRAAVLPLGRFPLIHVIAGVARELGSGRETL